MTGFGDTLVSKTCLFFLGSHVRGGGGGGGSLYLVFYGSMICLLAAPFQSLVHFISDPFFDHNIFVKQ